MKGDSPQEEGSESPSAKHEVTHSRIPLVRPKELP